jgi:hypothetical protein
MKLTLILIKTKKIRQLNNNYFNNNFNQIYWIKGIRTKMNLYKIKQKWCLNSKSLMMLQKYCHINLILSNNTLIQKKQINRK